jgi:hypothetical protein
MRNQWKVVGGSSLHKSVEEIDHQSYLVCSLSRIQANRGCATEAVNSRYVSRYCNRFYKVGGDGINGRH